MTIEDISKEIIKFQIQLKDEKDLKIAKTCVDKICELKSFRKELSLAFMAPSSFLEENDRLVKWGSQIEKAASEFDKAIGKIELKLNFTSQEHSEWLKGYNKAYSAFCRACNEAKEVL